MGETYTVTLTRFREIEREQPDHRDPSKPTVLRLRFDSTDGGQVVLQVTPRAALELMEGLQRYARAPGFQ